MKQNKNYWKKLGRELTEYVSQGNWRQERSIKVSHTSLFPIHNVGRGPNPGEPTLLDFNTRLTEASAIHFHFENKYNSLEIYINVKGNSANRIFFEVRKNGKNTDFTYKPCFSNEDQSYFVKEMIKLNGEDKYFSDDTLRETLKANGYSVVTEFAYSDVVSFSMPHHSGGSIRSGYIKQLKNGIEIGWLSSGTYNSIPNVVKIERSRGIKTESLSKLGIESRGYYSHHYNCNILPSQVSQAVSFFKSRFKNVSK